MTNNVIDLCSDSEESDCGDCNLRPFVNNVAVSVETRATETATMGRPKDDEHPNVESSESESEVDVVEKSK